MSIEFKLPAIGENIEKADIGAIRVKEGDVIAAEQLVIEVETDKAVFELPCPYRGKVAKIHVKQGQTVKVGELLLTLEETGAATPPPQPATPAAPAAAEKPSAPKADEPVASKPEVAVSVPPVVSSSGSNGELPHPPAGPATRRLARELGVDLKRIRGTGPGGRITLVDVHQAAARSSGGGGGVVVPALPDFAQQGPVERIPLNKLSKTAAANLSLSWQVVPHVTQHELIDVTELEAGRKRFTASHAKTSDMPKVTMTVLATKAVVAALKAFPQFNASFDAATGEVIQKKYYNIGIAVDTEHGLVVPVVKDADKKSVIQIAAEITDLAAKARVRKLSIAEMTGGTFTITNLGGIGGSFFTPIVNYPEVAILGMSRATQQYVITNDEAKIRLMMPVSLSYDHRVVNGADGARFITKLAQLLTDPLALLSEV
jgi:pyruvate dehydrogenase E2 component (dihydrolipoamide acetyltransferase)